ncbi:MAG: hypothetical protein WAT74_17790 [Flavobacteriales bacterium]
MTFAIKGETGNCVRLELLEIFGFPETTSHFGGYDARWSVLIKSHGFSAHGELWIATGELIQLCSAMRKSYDELKGSFDWMNSDEELRLKFKFEPRGIVIVSGTYRQYRGTFDRLDFEFDTDQTFVNETLLDMERLISDYGGMRGIGRK